ncbi:dihydroorotate dehydrogenase [Hallella multisaccharivorax DSM 17128]|uniref:Anion transporter n=1 Tax=Hallella multisaccharivorax DSM 17128 TaxID=688246 RepID=F8N9N5_9BACT|nr:SLC13 family permease [Hallella multisaccharivorax]EGN56677.1 anion transporter [Hallella multisaccharivorax DSM 17128]GJG30215.1 dihydroorotate dehydrogenase [Hallella multisaccharivorax DSM 17128]
MQETVKNALTGHFNKKKAFWFFLTALVTLIVWNLPSGVFGIEGLTIVQQRVIAIFVMAVMLWLTEAIPAWATSVTIIFVLLFFVSNSSFKFMQGSEGKYGQFLDSVGIMACFADPTIILFLGGFILAIAATKSGLDVWMAKTMIKPFGKRSENVLLGFLLITGIFSMFISNTATAAMMLTFLTPVFKALPANGKGRIALTMAIPIGANLGGMGTPIGTPPNAFAYKVLNDPTGMNMDISFGQWMAVMAPLVIILLIIAWFLLRKLFPFSQKTIELKIEGDMQHNWRTVVVGITFILTILLWIFGKKIGVNANTTAMLPIAVFAFTGVITAKDLQAIDWGVIWMVAGGFALGLAMNGTGLAKAAVESIPFGEWSPIVILMIAGLVCYFLSNFISNTATAALLIPILSVVCDGMGNKLSLIGGSSTILIGIAVAASAAMCLPISTPPNAIAYSTGLIQQKDMAKSGILIGVITLILGFSLLIVAGKAGIL